MYAIHVQHDIPRRRHAVAALAWRARWAIVTAAVVALLGAGFAREAASSSLGPTAATATETVTVAPGDTLWAIASRRYPDADPRQKVGQIEQLNGLGGSAIVPGQRLRLPAR